jgi:Rod binding domain-containing protein
MNAIAPAGNGAFLGLNVQGAPAVQVEEAARQVEGLFVSMLLKNLRETMASGMFEGDGADIWGGIFDQAMGDQIASAGGLGLVEQLQPRPLSIKA